MMIHFFFVVAYCDGGVRQKSLVVLVVAEIVGRAARYEEEVDE
jgi:hypothetical protein